MGRASRLTAALHTTALPTSGLRAPGQPPLPLPSTWSEATSSVSCLPQRSSGRGVAGCSGLSGAPALPQREVGGESSPQRKAPRLLSKQPGRYQWMRSAWHLFLSGSFDGTPIPCKFCQGYKVKKDPPAQTSEAHSITGGRAARVGRVIHSSP